MNLAHTIWSAYGRSSLLCFSWLECLAQANSWYSKPPKVQINPFLADVNSESVQAAIQQLFDTSIKLEDSAFCNFVCRLSSWAWTPRRWSACAIHTNDMDAPALDSSSSSSWDKSKVVTLQSIVACMSRTPDNASGGTHFLFTTPMSSPILTHVVLSRAWSCLAMGPAHGLQAQLLC